MQLENCVVVFLKIHFMPNYLFGIIGNIIDLIAWALNQAGWATL